MDDAKVEAVTEKSKPRRARKPKDHIADVGKKVPSKIVFERKVRWYGGQTFEFKESKGFAFKDVSLGVHVTHVASGKTATYVLIPYVLMDE